MDKIDQILDFWFGDITTIHQRYPEQAKIWYGKNPELDQTIKIKFENDIKNITTGNYRDWLQTARGRLAYIILLDQFTRNIYRQQKEAFTHDALALKTAIEGIQLNQDQELSFYERMFFYLPLEHAEDEMMQNKMIELAQALLAEAPDNEKVPFQQYLDYAIAHQQIILQFGRFPHRNNILNRQSTQAETAYLEQPNAGF